VFIVIASQRVGTERRPMTGFKKQSSAAKKELDCFASLAMTVLDFDAKGKK
jgi:hypothetical protein